MLISVYRGAWSGPAANEYLHVPGTGSGDVLGRCSPDQPPKLQRGVQVWGDTRPL